MYEKIAFVCFFCVKYFLSKKEKSPECFVFWAFSMHFSAF